MPFPPAERVVYGKNPLDQVICQLRFPPILRIDADLPADFQDQVRADFPNFSETSEFRIEGPSEISGQVPPEIIRQVIRSSGTKNYEFSSIDGTWKINLTRTFLALTTTDYKRWEDFGNKLLMPLQSLMNLYAPTYFSRIGLRYVDVIRRSGIGLDGVEWRELLSSPLIGMLGSPDTAGAVARLESVQEIRLAQNGGIARITAKLFKEKTEDVFVIDSDFFDDSRTEITDAIDRLNFFNSRSTRFIRWAVTKRLHEALEPESL